MKDARVAVVGSGVAATTVADILLRSSAASHVTMFEAGSRVFMADYRSWLDFVTKDLRPYADGLDKKLDIEGDEDLFRVRDGRLMVVGGSTVHWGGWCPRFKPEDFSLKTNTGRGLDWQFGYEELAPYYAKAERRLQVAGNSNRDDPPRYGKRFPVKSVPLTQKDGPVVQAFEELGYLNFGNLPIARNKGCITTGTCKYCPVQGKYDATMDLKPNSERFRLKYNCAVVEILMERKTKASGVKWYNWMTGEGDNEPFDYVFVCAGALESAKLLLRSTMHWREGLGNGTGHVGRHLVSHPLIRADGVVPKNPEAFEQELDFPTLECREFDTPLYQPEGKFYFVRDGRDHRIDFANELINGRSVSELEKQLVDRVNFRLSGFVEEFESEGNRVEIAKGTNKFGLPRTRIVYATHELTKKAKEKWISKMGEILRQVGVEGDIDPINYNPRCDHATSVCRMSATAAEGVVDGNCKVHDCDNVYVVSNAVFPNVAAVNPTLTLTALAIKVAESFS